MKKQTDCFDFSKSFLWYKFGIFVVYFLCRISSSHRISNIVGCGRVGQRGPVLGPAWRLWGWPASRRPFCRHSSYMQCFCSIASDKFSHFFCPVLVKQAIHRTQTFVHHSMHELSQLNCVCEK